MTPVGSQKIGRIWTPLLFPPMYSSSDNRSHVLEASSALIVVLQEAATPRREAGTPRLRTRRNREGRRLQLTTEPSSHRPQSRAADRLVSITINPAASKNRLLSTPPRASGFCFFLCGNWSNAFSSRNFKNGNASRNKQSGR